MRVYRCVTAREILNKYKKNTNRKKNNLTLNTHIYFPFLSSPSLRYVYERHKI